MAEVDFDLDAARAARAEARGEAKTFLFGGEVFTLPAECPFVFVELVSADRQRDAIIALLGADQAERFLAEDPSILDLAELVKGVAVAYGLGGAGNSSASNGSSPNGTKRSRQTSSASTG